MSTLYAMRMVSKQTKDTHTGVVTIKCNLGFWEVASPWEEVAVQKALWKFRDFFGCGAYNDITFK